MPACAKRKKIFCSYVFTLGDYPYKIKYEYQPQVGDNAQALIYRSVYLGAYISVII